MRLLLFFACFAVTCCAAIAQLPDATSVGAFEAELAGKRLLLRSFADDAVVHYTFGDGKLQLGAVQMRSFGVFVPQHVSVHGSQLIFTGKHGTIIRQNSAHTYGLNMDRDDMRIYVELGAGPVSLTNLKDEMFFPSVADALAGLPSYFAKNIPAMPRGTKPPSCDPCTQDIHGAEWLSIPSKSPEYHRPILIKSVNPEFPSDSPSGTNAQVEFGLVVDEKGLPSEVWLTQPSTSAYNDSALRAVTQYRFKPATYQGANVGSTLFVQINYAK